MAVVALIKFLTGTQEELPQYMFLLTITWKIRNWKYCSIVPRSGKYLGFWDFNNFRSDCTYIFFLRQASRALNFLLSKWYRFQTCTLWRKITSEVVEIIYSSSIHGLLMKECHRLQELRSEDFDTYSIRSYKWIAKYKIMPFILIK